MFDELVKKAFYRILMMNLKDYLDKPNSSLVSIYKSPL